MIHTTLERFCVDGRRDEELSKSPHARRSLVAINGSDGEDVGDSKGKLYQRSLKSAHVQRVRYPRVSPHHLLETLCWCGKEMESLLKADVLGNNSGCRRRSGWRRKTLLDNLGNLRLVGVLDTRATYSVRWCINYLRHVRGLCVGENKK